MIRPCQFTLNPRLAHAHMVKRDDCAPIPGLRQISTHSMLDHFGHNYLTWNIRLYDEGSAPAVKLIRYDPVVSPFVLRLKM